MAQQQFSHPLTSPTPYLLLYLLFRNPSNCRDGQGEGFDTELIDAVSKAVTIPVIASSGAGQPSHFSEVRPFGLLMLGDMFVG